MRYRARILQGLGATTLTLLIANSAHAAGFAIVENSASGMGNAFAGGGAYAGEASAVWFNPAGMSRLERRELQAAGHLIMLRADFENDGSTAATGGPLSGSNSGSDQPGFVPNVYFTMPVDDKWDFGIGINAPYGLATKFDDDWVGRYHAVESDMKVININPAFSYQATDQLSVGFGVSVQYIDVTLTSAIDFGGICVAALPVSSCAGLGLAPQQTDGFAEITGDSLGYGFNFGLLYQYSDQTRVSLAYRSKVDHDVEGESDFTVPGVAAFLTASGNFVDTDVTSDVSLPATLSLSWFHQMNDTWSFMADATWTGWSTLEELRIEYDSVQPDSVTTLAYEDTWRLAFGANYQLNDTTVLRGGIAWDQTPVPDAAHRTPRVPDDDRLWLAIGAGFQTSDDVTIDIGYAHLIVNDPKSDTEFESSVPTIQHTLTGSYDATVDILSAQVRWNF